MPRHCNLFTIKDVEFPLDTPTIEAEACRRRVMYRTGYMALRNGGDIAVVRVWPRERGGPIRRITQAVVLSLPHDTRWVEESDADVMDLQEMEGILRREGVRCVVVSGRFGHVNFMSDTGETSGPACPDGTDTCLDPLPSHTTGTLVLVDVIPPESKLVVAVEKLREEGWLPPGIHVLEHVVDLRELVSSSDGPVMFPCRASDLHSGPDTTYLDDAPALQDPEDIHLLGCPFSSHVFRSLYCTDPATRTEICPERIVLDGAHGLTRQPEHRYLVKCCRVLETFNVEDGIGVVPWGVVMDEVKGSIRGLFTG